MSERLNQLRVKLIPKQKFSFKSRKSASASPSPVPASPSPRPSTPQRSIDQSLFMKFEDRTGEHLFIGSLPVPSDESGAAKDVALTNLTDCTVNLVHNIPLGAIHIKNLKHCTLVIPPVSGSILLHDCEGCTLIGACHQVHVSFVPNQVLFYFRLIFLKTDLSFHCYLLLHFVVKDAYLKQHGHLPPCHQRADY